ncbi:MAG: hypothetical protein COV33_01045 [Candidatus Zambryskibacteria bacterium CG10_big_fil_rev_8_21_14_0_10_34_34]|uniref:Uncharacterized protein n=1 Tax=Candidatus Zambryskibacteria bacterium CG10_big_fil_rev_8_21_14_0_10_34_34 TaxID=1975114 RepID=A0A2H0R112_9BACT|nr:MAG: hypothetical protein COV33_01045 [Candidatus Zambryskibacteria bacterium CG10_big_fil_rev_8_21_14_0_10_34_34]
MLIKKYNSIMEKSEEYRNRWALGLTVVCSIFIFIGWGFFTGFLSFRNDNQVIGQKSGSQTASVVSAKLVPTPIENTKNTFKSVFNGMKEQYKEFKDSMADVFVPFITGIDFYERK